MSFQLLLAAVAASLLPGGLPAGWVAQKTLSPALQRCGGYSKQAWRVTLQDGKGQIERELQPERSSGPTVPAALPELKARGQRHTLAVPGGFLVGTDAGEWGGGLFAVGVGGTPVKELVPDNVQGVMQRGDEVVTLHGLNHMGVNRGTVHWLARAADGTWKVTGTAKLDSGPQAFVETKDAVYVATLDSLVRIGADHKASVVQPLPLTALYPSSMIVDAQGTIWVGMRHFVLRLQPSGARFTEEWLTPRGCDKARQVDSDCVCAK